MGLIRLLLAISVVLAHVGGSGGYDIVGGRAAVQTFFMISGYYMALVLEGKYAGKYGLFLANRCLRVFPLYWVVLLMTLFWSSLTLLRFGHASRLDVWQQYGSSLDTASLSALLFTNLALIGHEMSVFFGLDVDTGRLFLARDYRVTDPQLHFFMVVPQAWSLSTELCFYLLAPWLSRRSTLTLVLVAMASAAVRVGLAVAGLRDDPWDYRFFPSELLLFVAGMLAFRRGRARRFAPLERSGVGFALVLIGMVVFPWLPGPAELKHWIFFVAFWTAMPWVFEFTRSNPRDRLAGDLSYPVYLAHGLVFLVAGVVSGDPRLRGAITLVASLLVAVILHLVVQRPLDRARSRRVPQDVSFSPSG